MWSQPSHSLQQESGSGKVIETLKNDGVRRFGQHWKLLSQSYARWCSESCKQVRSLEKLKASSFLKLFLWPSLVSFLSNVQYHDANWAASSIFYILYLEWADWRLLNCLRFTHMN